MATDLRFAQPPGGASFVLGADVGNGAAPIDGLFAGFLPALVFSARAIPNASATFAATLPDMTLAATGEYRSRAARPVVGSVSSGWQHAMGFLAGAQERVESTQRFVFGAGTRWQAAMPQIVGVESRRATVLARCDVLASVRFGAAWRLGTSVVRSPYQDGVHLRTARVCTFAETVRLPAVRAEVRHQEGLRDRRREFTSRFQEAVPHAGRTLTEIIQSAHPLHRDWRTRWQDAMRPPPGRHPVIPVDDGEEPPFDPCYTPNPNLLFSLRAATDAHLIFLCENHPAPGQGGTVVVPIRRVYVVLNHVTLYRWPDGAAVPVFTLSLSLDAASWTWGFEASLPAIAESLIAPTDGASPVELVAHVNGTDFRVLAESLSRERAFGEVSLRVSGRGRNAVLAAPFAPVLNFSNPNPRTARQLMDDVLTVNGVPLGWDVDWGLVDWNVPAGVFAQQGTWIEAVAAIAAAAGGYVMPHPNDSVLRVRHRYPFAPWDWPQITPDLVLPVDAVSRESLRWLEKPAYNRVFVSGQNAGVLGQVTRSGTAGNLIAPMIVDPLITEAAAARQRGLAVLADTGKQYEVGLRLPVLPETGIVEPGTFIEYQDGSVARIGLVRSTRIEAGLPEVWQTLGVECHA